MILEGSWVCSGSSEPALVLLVSLTPSVTDPALLALADLLGEAAQMSDLSWTGLLGYDDVLSLVSSYDQPLTHVASS